MTLARASQRAASSRRALAEALAAAEESDDACLQIGGIQRIEKRRPVGVAVVDLLIFGFGRLFPEALLAAKRRHVVPGRDEELRGCDVVDGLFGVEWRELGGRRDRDDASDELARADDQRRRA